VEESIRPCVEAVRSFYIAGQIKFLFTNIAIYSIITSNFNRWNRWARRVRIFDAFRELG